MKTSLEKADVGSTYENMCLAIPQSHLNVCVSFGLSRACIAPAHLPLECFMVIERFVLSMAIVITPLDGIDFHMVSHCAHGTIVQISLGWSGIILASPSSRQKRA